MKHWLYSLRRMRGLPDGWHALALAMLLFRREPAPVTEGQAVSAQQEAGAPAGR